MQVPNKNFEYFLSRLWLIPLFCICTCLVAGILFGDLFIPFTYLIPGISAVVVFVWFYRKIVPIMTNSEEKGDVRKLFVLSLVIRLVCVVLLYFVFLNITGTPQHPDAVDSIFYHNMGLDISEEIHRGIFNPLAYATGSFNYDDIGHGALIGILYAIFGPYYLVLRIFHALIGAWTVVFGYKIMKTVWEREIAIKGALLLSLFPSVVYLTATHDKETVMIFFVFMFLYSVLCMFSTKRFQLIKAAMLLMSVGAMIFIRLPLAVLMILTTFSALPMQSVYHKRLKICVYVILSMASLIFLTQQIGVYSGSMERLQHSVGLSADRNIYVKGHSADQFVRQGMSYGKYLSAPLGLTLSLFTPFPSIVKTNLRFFNQTEHWWYLSGLFIYGSLSYFSLLGLIDSIRNKFSKTYIICVFVLGYSCMLGLSNYFTSIRFNMVKLPVMLMFVVPGIMYSSLSAVKKWNLGLFCLCVVILIWNYIKVSGRGLM